MLKFFKIFIFVSLFISGYCNFTQSKFKLIKNVQASYNFEQLNILTSFPIKYKINCLAKCNEMAIACMMAIFSISKCNIYGSSVSVMEMIPSATNETKLFKKVEKNCSSNQFFDGISCCKFKKNRK